jgi:hypothetical protein
MIIIRKREIRGIGVPDRIVVKQSMSVVHPLYGFLLSRRIREYDMTVLMLAPKSRSKVQ